MSSVHNTLEWFSEFPIDSITKTFGFFLSYIQLISLLSSWICKNDSKTVSCLSLWDMKASVELNPNQSNVRTTYISLPPLMITINIISIVFVYISLRRHIPVPISLFIYFLLWLLNIIVIGMFYDNLPAFKLNDGTNSWTDTIYIGAISCILAICIYSIFVISGLARISYRFPIKLNGKSRRSLINV